MNVVDGGIYGPKQKKQWNPCDAFLICVFLEKEKAIVKSRECYAVVELTGEVTRGQVAIYHVTGSQKPLNVKMVEIVNSELCKSMLHWTASP